MTVRFLSDNKARLAKLIREPCSFYAALAAGFSQLISPFLQVHGATAVRILLTGMVRRSLILWSLRESRDETYPPDFVRGQLCLPGRRGSRHDRFPPPSSGHGSVAL